MVGMLMPPQPSFSYQVPFRTALNLNFTLPAQIRSDKQFVQDMTAPGHITVLWRPVIVLLANVDQPQYSYETSTLKLKPSNTVIEFTPHSAHFCDTVRMRRAVVMSLKTTSFHHHLVSKFELLLCIRQAGGATFSSM